jgi:hypothetical protein
VPDRRHEPSAVGGPAVPAAVVPAPAPEHPVRVLGRVCRAFGICNLLGGIRRIPIRTPLPDIALHVVQTERIGGVQADVTGGLQIGPLIGTAVGFVAVEIGFAGGQGAAVASLPTLPVTLTHAQKPRLRLRQPPVPPTTQPLEQYPGLLSLVVSVVSRATGSSRRRPRIRPGRAAWSRPTERTAS